MKLIEIINRRCNCTVTKIEVTSKLGSRIAYRNKPCDNCNEYTVDIESMNVKISVTYSANVPLNQDAISLMTDLIDVYIENRATWEIAENVSKSPEIYAGRATLDEMVKVTTDALVYSDLFDKAAIMFFNEKKMELRGIYISSIPPYSEEKIKAFKNKRIPITRAVLQKFEEYKKHPEDIDAHIEVGDELLHILDGEQLKNPLLIVPMMTGNKLYGILITYSEKKYFNTHIFTTRSTARLLNTMMMAVISHQKYEFTTAFYKEIESEMRSKESLATLGNYVATIAHEVKNPLISIGGFAKRIMKSVTGEDLKKMAGIIATESVRLEHLTEDILSFSRKRPPKKEKINLIDLMTTISLLFENRIVDCRFKLKIDIPEDAYIYADIDQIKQVIVNLITNAMNAMECDGTVHITYEEHDNKTSISISDTGPGIPIEVMPNLFKPFFTTSSAGTGLGLPISRKILQNHNGELNVYNSENGAVFTLTLPMENK